MVEIGLFGSWECYILMLKMFFFIADLLIGKDRLVVQKECNAILIELDLQKKLEVWLKKKKPVNTV